MALGDGDHVLRIGVAVVPHRVGRWRDTGGDAPGVGGTGGWGDALESHRGGAGGCGVG